jgi:hypothetical protein
VEFSLYIFEVFKHQTLQNDLVLEERAKMRGLLLLFLEHLRLSDGDVVHAHV